MSVIQQERASEAMGVKGRFQNVATWPDGGRIANQKFVSCHRKTESGTQLQVTIRFDDNCKNGHESFSITATEYENGRDVAGGCMHDDIVKVFPEFEPLIAFHLCSVDGPMHYVSNTCFMAGDRDCWGLQKGELRYKNELVARDDEHRISLDKTKLHGLDIPAKYDWQEKHRRPGPGEEHTEGAIRRWLPVSMMDPNSDADAFDMLQLSPINKIGEGEERMLNAARRAAIWPEATDGELCSSKEVLTGLLEERLPGLLFEFRTLVENFGFLYSA
jgi:hypothetical protein